MTNTTVTESGAAEGFETRHVHEVYEEIAEHFSETRYKVGFSNSLKIFSTYMFFSIFLYCTSKPLKYWSTLEGRESHIGEYLIGSHEVHNIYI